MTDAAAAEHPFIPLSGSQDTGGRYTRCAVDGCRLAPDAHSTTQSQPAEAPGQCVDCGTIISICEHALKRIADVTNVLPPHAEAPPARLSADTEAIARKYLADIGGPAYDPIVRELLALIAAERERADRLAEALSNIGLMAALGVGSPTPSGISRLDYLYRIGAESERALAASPTTPATPGPAAPESGEDA